MPGGGMVQAAEVIADKYIDKKYFAREGTPAAMPQISSIHPRPGDGQGRRRARL